MWTVDDLDGTSCIQMPADDSGLPSSADATNCVVFETAMAWGSAVFPLLLLILVGIVFIVGSAHRAENELNNLTIDATGPLGVVEAIQTGILMSQAYDRRQNGPPGHFLATLGGADGSASTTNRLFANVLEPGVSDGSWSQAGATFTYTHGSVISIYDYNAATGAFTKR